MNTWIVYNVLVGFAVYWASNLVLWFPWSYSPTLGITLMLTASPIIWAISTFYCLKTYPKKKLIHAALYNSAIFLTLSVLMDYIFFGLIRDAMEDLYHPTTFYGYGFVIALPFLAVLGFKNRIEKKRRKLLRSDFKIAGTIGLLCFGILAFIVGYGIEI